MQILILASGNNKQISPFVKEQAHSLIKEGVLIDFYLIKGKGLIGYLKNYFSLLNKLKNKKYNLLHAHYGLSGLLATMQFSVPVIITFHGSDVNMKKNYLFSRIASNLSATNIFVHNNLSNRLKIYSKPLNIIPCGVDDNTFFPISKSDARKKLGWKKDNNYILFSSSFDNKIKNVSLAESAVSTINNSQLIELKGFKKEQINLLLNASDLLLVTSFSETGPIIVKEALACNCPIVSTDVGDVKKLIKNINNCHLTTYNANNIKEKINLVLKDNNRTNGRIAIQKFRLEKIAYEVLSVYQNTLKHIKNN